MGDIIELIKKTIQENSFVVMCAIVVNTVAIVIVIIDRVNKRNKYVIWKKQTINIGIYTREWERSEDALVQQLFDANERLEKENKALKKEYSQLTLVLLLLLVFIVVSSWFVHQLKSGASKLSGIFSVK